MPKYLVIIPEQDYEMLNDGREALDNLNRAIVDAPSIEKAIEQKVGDDFSDLEPSSVREYLQNAFVIEVKDKAFDSLAPGRIEEIMAPLLQPAKDAERAADEANFAALKLKLGK